jgi:hypothetical protein
MVQGQQQQQQTNQNTMNYISNGLSNSNRVQNGKVNTFIYRYLSLLSLFRRQPMHF